ncbi:MAG: N-acetylmuramoyl-L-alanine amidase [Paludibacteraceae bacterium]|nr:N-acetylmuramoyl-L-alanine amidase [Paludibacteraceae bacterium]
MIILTAGHTGAGTGAQCAETHFDEGAENIWLRNRIAEILTNKYNLVVLIDNDNASLSLVTKQINENATTEDIVIDLHFNAHPNPNARGTEAIISDNATTMELRFASRLAHATAEVLEIPLRSIKSETQTPHRRLAMLHLTPQSIILEVCFCTSPEDAAQYRKHRELLANTLAKNIAEIVSF